MSILLLTWSCQSRQVTSKFLLYQSAYVSCCFYLTCINISNVTWCYIQASCYVWLLVVAVHSTSWTQCISLAPHLSSFFCLFSGITACFLWVLPKVQSKNISATGNHNQYCSNFGSLCWFKEPEQANILNRTVGFHLKGYLCIVFWLYGLFDLYTWKGSAFLSKIDWLWFPGTVMLG